MVGFDVTVILELRPGFLGWDTMYFGIWLPQLERDLLLPSFTVVMDGTD
jgi:hypothetical protein